LQQQPKQSDAERRLFHCHSTQPQAMHSTQLLQPMKHSLQSKTNAPLQSIINFVAIPFTLGMGARSQFFHL
jgi:hypothetical protein